VATFSGPVLLYSATPQAFTDRSSWQDWSSLNAGAEITVLDANAR
jgi:hypothetical protein